MRIKAKLIKIERKSPTQFSIDQILKRPGIYKEDESDYRIVITSLGSFYYDSISETIEKLNIGEWLDSGKSINFTEVTDEKIQIDIDGNYYK